MDYLPLFRREVLAFETAVRRALAEERSRADSDRGLVVPSCPEWSVAELVMHLGGVHRGVNRIVGERLAELPENPEATEGADLRFLELPADLTGWPLPGSDAVGGPVPPGLIDWFARGASALAALFESVDSGEAVWTYGQDRTVGFWARVQSIEVAIHRWDAEGAIGVARPIDAEFAADAVRQTFEVMAPARREWTRAPQGVGERYRFRQTDGPGDWAVEFDGGDVRLAAGSLEPCDVEVSGTASDLMLFLWHRIPADRLAGVKGDREALDRWFTLVPPV